MNEQQPKWYDEEKEMPQPLAWLVIILFSASIVGYGVVTYLLVDDGPRHWDYRILADTPAESVYNTAAPRQRAEAPPQMAPLPGSGRGGR